MLWRISTTAPGAQIAAAGGAAPRFGLLTGRDRKRWQGEGGGGSDGPTAQAAAGDDTQGAAEVAQGDVLDLLPCYDLVRRAVRAVRIMPEGRGRGAEWSAERMEEARRCVEIGTAALGSLLYSAVSTVGCYTRGIGYRERQYQNLV